MEKLLGGLIKDKRILILGFGREGQSTLKMLLKIGGYERLMVADFRDVCAECPDGVDVVWGTDYQKALFECDVVFKSPGVVLEKEEAEYPCVITSQVEIFLEKYKGQTIGITGTKGKSTTSSLINHCLLTSGKDVLFAGNIGLPVFEIANDVKDGTIVVLELSCHQLEYAKTSPRLAVLLNIYEDHLDHYGTREKYAKSKKNIYLYQQKDDILFTTSQVLEEFGAGPAKTVTVSLQNAPIGSFSELEGAKLKGKHNLLNAAFAYLTCKECGMSKEDFLKGLESFSPLSHRLEYLGKKNGVDYYDDSISTTVKSTISAVESIENAGIILLGGMERNLDYGELIEYLTGSKLRVLVFMYESGMRMFKMYEEISKTENSPQAVYFNDLEASVNWVKENAKEGEAVLLSPAAASYGHFRNFEERGDIYKSLVF